MQKIIPLKYKIKLWKNCLSEEKIKKYSTPEYLKERLENEFRLNEHLIDPTKIFVKKHNSKDISIEEPIEIDEFENVDFVFIKFKYWDKVAKNDNWKIIDDGEVIQIIVDKGSLLTDFYFWMEFNIKPDSKFLIIEWNITTVQKSNEQMKSQILNLFEKDIYLQDKNDEYKPEYSLKFKFEEQEIKNIEEKIRWLEVFTEIIPESKLDQAENWVKEKWIPIRIDIWWWNQSKIVEYIINAIKNIPWIWETKKRAIVSYWKSKIKSDFSDDLLTLSLKSSFLYSEESISYERFKQETYKYIFPNIEF